MADKVLAALNPRFDALEGRFHAVEGDVRKLTKRLEVVERRQRQPAQAVGEQSAGRPPLRCYECGRQGHIARRCPDRVQGGAAPQQQSGNAHPL